MAPPLQLGAVVIDTRRSRIPFVKFQVAVKGLDDTAQATDYWIVNSQIHFILNCKGTYAMCRCWEILRTP